MYDELGEKTWDCTLDVYGKVANFEGSSLKECPFRYQGQYEDEGTGLYYNRFRYYSAEEGMYISQDPIRLAGGNLTLYAYVHDPNNWLDPFGLKGCPPKDKKPKEPVGGVYVLKDRKGNVERTGRTKNSKKREAQHKAKYGDKYEFEHVYKTDDYKEQRGLEDKVYKQHEATANASNGGLNKMEQLVIKIKTRMIIQRLQMNF